MRAHDLHVLETLSQILQTSARNPFSAPLRDSGGGDLADPPDGRRSSETVDHEGRGRWREAERLVLSSSGHLLTLVKVLLAIC